jgi:glutamate-5-semialdehyde dehydrogenase
MDLMQVGRQAKAAAKELALISTQQKNELLTHLAALLVQNSEEILFTNQIDIQNAHTLGFSDAFIDRLRITPGRMDDIVAGVRNVAALEDPVGAVFDPANLSNGLEVHKQRVPLGVIAVIYESRPNVTVDVACLTLKSGNAVILRGGKETVHSNRAFVKLVHQALSDYSMPVAAVQFIDSPDRSLVMELLQMSDSIDMLIPRGSDSLQKFCRENSRIPVITGGIGICHLFVDATADQKASLEVIHNAKTQRPSVCNALDTLLVHEAIARDFIPLVVERLTDSGVSLHVSADVYGWFTDRQQGLILCKEEDYDREWLSLNLGIRVVSGIDEAIDHVQEHSTGHSDGILTGTKENADRFVAEVDSAAVYVNASTRFTDGSQLGLGAEVAISTQRLHARGPMALEALTTYKWVIQGDYQVRQ